jgi:hypothetical protein
LISKAKAVWGAAILIVAAAAISAIVVSNWSLFAPKDYEDCAARAAKDAKSKEGLSVLLSVCRSEFEGRRKASGGYTYYDNCQEKTFDIKGPNRNADELKNIKTECLGYLDEQAAAERQVQQVEWRRKIEAMSHIHVIFANEVGCGSVSCPGRFEVTNESDEALSNVLVGSAFTKGTCPSRYAEQHALRIKVSPGEARSIEGSVLAPGDYRTVRSIAGSLSRASTNSSRLCIEVLDVQFARN